MSSVMPSQTGYAIAGLNETFKMMADLNSKEKQFIIRGILRKVANKVVKPAMQAANPYKSSKKQPGVNPFVVTFDKHDLLGIKVGVSSKFFYYRFTEFGTAPRSTKHRAVVFNLRKSGKLSKGRIKKVGDKANRGKMKGAEKIYPAIENSIPSVVAYINANYSMETKKRMDALARKKAKL
jgi:HK97 gp10 family phage protein